ncbi:MAG: cyclic nucleotide-binding domain-containing protein [Devosia sp.]
MAPPLLKHLSRLTPAAFAAGATLIAEGAATPALFVLATGTLEVLRAGEVVATLAEPGAVVGEMAALLGRSASATVRAKTAATAYIIDDPERFFEKSPAVLLEIARTLAQRLDTTTDFLVQSRHRFAGQEDMAFLEDVFALLGAEPTTPVTGTRL